MIEKVTESIAQTCIIYHQYIKSTGKLRNIAIQHESAGSFNGIPWPVPSKMKAGMLTSQLGLKLKGALPQIKPALLNVQMRCCPPIACRRQQRNCENAE